MAKLPEPSFILIVQLHHLQAMLHLGLIQNPQTGKANQPNLQKAKHELALLEILRDKTKGNLDDEEERLLGEILQALEMNIDAIESGQ